MKERNKGWIKEPMLYKMARFIFLMELQEMKLDGGEILSVIISNRKELKNLERY